MWKEKGKQLLAWITLSIVVLLQIFRIGKPTTVR
ncbi:DUF3975 family protein [Bacillus pacificus]